MAGRPQVQAGVHKRNVNAGALVNQAFLFYVAQFIPQETNPAACQVFPGFILGHGIVPGCFLHLPGELAEIGRCGPARADLQGAVGAGGKPTDDAPRLARSNAPDISEVRFLAGMIQ